MCENESMNTKRAVNIVLEQIGSEGLSGVRLRGSSAPDALKQLKLADFDDAMIARALAEMRRQDLVEITKNGQEYRLQLSVKGIHRLQRAQVERIIIARPDTWDGLWRMVTYDVPRAQSAQRRLFARQLERLGFTMIRESVWFHPYSCFGQVEEIMTYCGLQRYVTFAEITRIDNVSLGKLKRAYPNL